MSARRKLRVAIVGLRFGARFVPIYAQHPDVEHVAVCDSNEGVLSKIGDAFAIERRFTSLQPILRSDEYDAVHLATPIPLHAEQTIAVLESGKHCACAVPMATSIKDIRAIIAAQRRTKKNYMMLETEVYRREFLYIHDLLHRGEIGRIQFLRGAHYQDMEGWPAYWKGLPPMYYATHATGPVLALARTRASEVHCFGSGCLREELQTQYNNPFPVETAIFRLEGTNLAAEVTRSMFQTPRSSQEGFCLYGENITFEWPQVPGEDPVIYTWDQSQATGLGRGVRTRRVSVPDRQDLLPKEIARFTQRDAYDETHLSPPQGGWNGGAIPHLVHEFVRSIVEERRASVDEVTAADWTAAGICAHESAMKGGERVMIPSFD